MVNGYIHKSSHFVRKPKKKKYVLKPEQKLMIRIADWLDGNELLWDIFHHPPNEGKRSIQEGAMLKRMGMRKDTPDLIILYPCWGFHGLIIEVKELNPKTGKYGRPTSGQKRKIQKLNDLGYHATFGYGYDATIKIIEDYLKDEL